jgi:hypothetical protein
MLRHRYYVFNLLLQVVKCHNSSDLLLKNEKIYAIDGDLRPCEYLMGQYNKSVPFYKNGIKERTWLYTI